MMSCDFVFEKIKYLHLLYIEVYHVWQINSFYYIYHWDIHAVVKMENDIILCFANWYYELCCISEMHFKRQYECADLNSSLHH